MQTTLNDNQVLETVENIWKTILDMEISRGEQGVTSLVNGGRRCYVSSCIQLTGAWEGSVVLHTTRELAQQMAAVMFDMDAEQLEFDDIKDTMGELGNITAGNLKLLLPRTCEISLPTVIDGSDYRLEVPGSVTTTKLLLTCCGEPLIVSIFEKTEDTGGNG